MGQLLFCLSNLNAVNGLNLTRNQAEKLLGLARVIEAVADKPPAPDARVSPALTAAQASWQEVRGLLLAGKPVPKALEDRVLKGREAESRYVRATLLPDSNAPSPACSVCHGPALPEGRGEPPLRPPAYLKTAATAHLVAVYGLRGMSELVHLSPQVDAVLTDAQKAILGSFTCCLVPPSDLSDPVRAGQAETSDRAVELLRQVRRCPESLWPLARAGVLQRFEGYTLAVSPGADATRQQQVREDVGRALDEARAMSDVEFEMRKGELVHGARGAVLGRPANDWPHKAAFFLLLPGSVEAYTRYLARLDPDSGTEGRR
jgi:mono/diheme cytochrome c family protein